MSQVSTGGSTLQCGAGWSLPCITCFSCNWVRCHVTCIVSVMVCATDVGGIKMETSGSVVDWNIPPGGPTMNTSSSSWTMAPPRAAPRRSEPDLCCCGCWCRSDDVPGGGLEGGLGGEKSVSWRPSAASTRLLDGRGVSNVASLTVWLLTPNAQHFNCTLFFRFITSPLRL